MRNESQYFRVQLKIIEFVIEYQQQKLLNFISGCVRNSKFVLKTLGHSSDELIDPIIRDAREEKEFISDFVKQRRLAKQGAKAQGGESRPSVLAPQSLFRSDETKKRMRDESSEDDLPSLKKARGDQ